MSKEEYKEVLKSMAVFHNYSYSNQIILHFSGASQVAGFKRQLHILFVSCLEWIENRGWKYIYEIHKRW